MRRSSSEGSIPPGGPAGAPPRRTRGPRPLVHPSPQPAIARAQIRRAVGKVLQREKRQAKPFVALLICHADRAVSQRAAHRCEIRYRYYELVLLVCLKHALLHGSDPLVMA